MAYGNYPEFVKNKKDYIDLTTKPIMLKKLKMLTLVQMAQNQKVITYDEISNQCGLAHTIEEVEELIMDAFSNELIECRIDQRNRTIHVLQAFARDVRPDLVAGLVE